MSFFDSLRDAAEWREHPMRNAGRAITCAISPFTCVSEQGSQQVTSLTRTAIQAAEQAREQVQNAAESVSSGGLGEFLGIPSAEDITAVGTTIENIMMWISVIAGILLVAIILGVVIYFVH